MRNLQLLLPAALGALTLSGCVYDEPSDSGPRYDGGRSAYRGSAYYDRGYDSNYDRRDVVIADDPYYSYDGVQYYSSGGRYYYNRGPRRIYIETLPLGGRYLGRHDYGHDNYRNDRYSDRDDRRSYYSGSRSREDNSSNRREQEIRSYEAKKAQERNRGIASVDQEKARERQYDLQKQGKVQSYEQKQAEARARYIQQDKEGTSNKKKKEKKKD